MDSFSQLSTIPKESRIVLEKSLTAHLSGGTMSAPLALQLRAPKNSVKTASASNSAEKENCP
jgi:hypothetical protein